MELSKLLYYVEHIQRILPKGGDNLLSREYDPIIHYVENHDLCQPNHLQSLKNARDLIKQGLEEFDIALDDIDAWVKQESTSLQHDLLAQSYSIYEDMTSRSNSYLYQADAVLNNRAPLSEEMRKFVYSRLAIRNTWKDAALIIRPGLEDWIENMVSFDPLYVFDHYQDLLEPAQKKFNQKYNSRVRWCVGNDHDERGIFHAIPDVQIGFCFAWHFFYWKPFEIIRQYLKELYTKLTPGGILAFTFNDGDRFGGADNAERACGCFVPGSMLRSFGESIGYETVLYHELDRATTWIEFRKPGNRVSIKGGQSIAKIIPKVTNGAVDTPSSRVYTEEEIKFLRQQAIELKIDVPEVIDHGAYSPSKLEYLIKSRKDK